MLKELRSVFQKIPYNLKLFLAVILQGLVSGLSGIFLHYLLKMIEEIAFDQSEHQTVFLTDGVSSSRIGLSLIIVGVSSSLVWYFLQKKSQIFSIKAQMKDEISQYKLHFLKQLFHSIWQIIAVGGGAPIGKEAAPREIGTLFAGPIGKICSLSKKDQIFLLACGAGAGLAAVYQVPLTSVFFVFETLGIGLSIKRFVLVGLTTYVSTYTAGLVISDHALYQIPAIAWSLKETWIIPLLLLFLTPLAWLFGRLSKEVSSNRIKDKRILLTLPTAFLFLAGLASYFPHLLGNGRMMAQEVLNGSSIPLVYPKSTGRSYYSVGRGLWWYTYAIFCLGDGWSCSFEFHFWSRKLHNPLTFRFSLFFNSNSQGSFISYRSGSRLYWSDSRILTLSSSNSVCSLWIC